MIYVIQSGFKWVIISNELSTQLSFLSIDIGGGKIYNQLFVVF